SYQQYQAYYQQPPPQPVYQPAPTYQSYQYAPQPSTSTSMARAAITNSHSQSTSNNAGALDTSDVATLNDALGSAGVDLRAEEEGLQRSHEQPQSFRPSEDRSRKQPPRPNFDVHFLGRTMRTIATHHKVNSGSTPAGGVPEDCVNYLALALRARLQDLVTAMIDAARHRTSVQFDRPASVYDDGSTAWSILVRADVGKQLAVLEQVEREEELRLRQARESRERAIDEAISAALAGEDLPVIIPNGDVDMGTPRKRRKRGDEEVGYKMANATASRAAGLTGKYAWLATGLGGATPSRERARPYKTVKQQPTPPPLPLNADKRTPITIRDAMFAIEKERGHGGGRGAARGWS
ncbi:transcription initiation factor TFIID component TAF4 family-domain-containing protein, partial [Roridomyces roridus]